MKAKAYGIRGRCGYVHADCYDAFDAANSRHDALGRRRSGPMIDSMLYDLGHAGAGKCLHCGLTLAPAKSKSNPSTLGNSSHGCAGAHACPCPRPAAQGSRA